MIPQQGGVQQPEKPLPLSNANESSKQMRIKSPLPLSNAKSSYANKMYDDKVTTDNRDQTNNQKERSYICEIWLVL